MMGSSFSILLIPPITGDSAGFTPGTVAAKKGSAPHLLTGIIFFGGMLAASIVALIMNRLPEYYDLRLLTVGGVALYMVFSGYKIVVLKRKWNHQPVAFSVTIGILISRFLGKYVKPKKHTHV